MNDDTMPPPIDPLTCGPGTVPGWLNEDGLPTSCVGDLPNPEAPEDMEFPDGTEFIAEPAPVEPPPVPVPPALPDREIPVVTDAGEIPVETPANETTTGSGTATWDGRELAHTGPLGDVLLALVIGIALVFGGVLLYSWHIRLSWRKGK